LEIHLVAHTHWDREWYHTAEVFRRRLVELVDELIDRPPRDGEGFLLDGQAIVIEDYLDVREDRREQLASLLRSGRIEAGPWYVLADELIPSGEALVRNLLVGRAVLARLGATALPILYCPDSFGHPAALPEIAAGFDLPLVVLWRGFGGARWPRGDVVRWKAPSGAQALVFHLPPDGYEFGASLPVEADALARRWERIRGILAPRSTVGITLLQNGADHHARQPDLDRVVQQAQKLAEKNGDRLRASSMGAFADAVVARAGAQRLPVVSGELRDSYGYTWTLQGTFATRAAQKRANAIVERTLIREAEPWSAVAWLEGKRGQAHHLHAAWKTLLQAHPHDTLCGTSVDDVAAAMDLRLRSAGLQANAVTRDAIDGLLGDDPSGGDEATDLIVLRNDSVRPRSGVAIIDLIEKVVDEPVGPGSGAGPRIDDLRETDDWQPKLPAGVQLLDARLTRDRLESPLRYPDNDIVRVATLAVRVPPIPAMGLSLLDSLDGLAPDSRTRIRVSSSEISNTLVNCGFEKGGTLSLQSGETIAANLVRFEDRGDTGDLYTASIGAPVADARILKQTVVHKGPLIGQIHQRWHLAASGEKRGAGRGTIELSIRLSADSPLLELRVAGVNSATNHRLRIGIATGVAKASVFADAAFGPVERVPIEITSSDAAMEAAPATAPLHRYVSLFAGRAGATVFSDGLAEYEADAAGTVWITLVRAVGDLSRNDLPERPGHAGWPVDTPAAQSLGRFEGRFAILLHGARSAAVIDDIEREADRFLHPLRGFTLRAASRARASVSGPELSGVGLALSAMKASEDGEWVVLRCVNLTDRESSGRWTMARPIKEAKLARLDETPVSDLPVSDESVVDFVAGPRAVVTTLVR
jgi:alpha-mannosidase